jgi:hypothetical protein
MPKIQYIEKRFRAATLMIILRANEIIDEYRAAGYRLTLRQLYYKFIARDLFPNDWIDEAYNLKHGLAPDTKNTTKNYSRLGGIINDGRLAGKIDWDAIEDRTRNLHKLQMWKRPRDIIKSAANWYLTDKWKTQKYRIEVWIEKEALAGVFVRICDELEIPFFACRGYNSQSEMWRAGRRLCNWEDMGYKTVILYFGDHDPSGLDMPRDIQKRLKMFGSKVKVETLALTMGQINQYDPPPNPAKGTDSRYRRYVAELGIEDSWELDALEPDVLSQLVEDRVLELRDDKEWERQLATQEKQRSLVQDIYDDWEALWFVKDTWLAPDDDVEPLEEGENLFDGMLDDEEEGD